MNGSTPANTSNSSQPPRSFPIFVPTFISCSICTSVFAPNKGHEHLLQAPPAVLESAFMSMCHFCFRCRRPACPQCWDDINGLCAECGQEVHLPFRAEAVPLTGTLFPPARRKFPATHKGPAPLVCTHAGRFQLPIDQRPTLPIPVATAEQDSASVTGQYPSLFPSSPQQSIRLRNRSTRQTVERTITWIVLTLLIIIIALIVAAALSVETNAFLLRNIHIDIRAELAYLWQLIQQLHW